MQLVSIVRSLTNFLGCNLSIWCNNNPPSTTKNSNTWKIKVTQNFNIHNRDIIENEFIKTENLIFDKDNTFHRNFGLPMQQFKTQSRTNIKTESANLKNLLFDISNVIIILSLLPSSTLHATFINLESTW